MHVLILSTSVVNILADIIVAMPQLLAKQRLVQRFVYPIIINTQESMYNVFTLTQ